MQKTFDPETQAQKNHSAWGPPRAKPIPRHLIRTSHQVAITRHGQRADLGVLLSLEAGQKLSPRRFFALLVVALGDE